MKAVPRLAKGLDLGANDYLIRQSIATSCWRGYAARCSVKALQDRLRENYAQPIASANKRADRPL